MPRVLTLLLLLASALPAQVYSPKVLRKGQPDSTNLRAFAQGIYAAAGAQTPRERAEAIWRYFLTDGRFVQPGFWYHIAGWAYEEPQGEVLDSLKLLNSYGFGLCYHIAPLLADVWKAGGFEDARVWFLTGHTVAEVFYDGAYHHYDSDMMGYSTIGGPIPTVASVRQLEKDEKIILNMLKGPRPDPWYPADVRANAIPGLAELFTTTADNHLFPLQRSPQTHSIDFTLRPGERLTRYYQPERPDLFYLPYQFNGTEWREFPQEIAQYQIKTADGPRSQKDNRLWATGKLEYRPVPPTGESTVYSVRSPYVIIDAEFQFDATLASPADSVTLETSADEGRTWTHAATLKGPHSGLWTAEPTTLTRSAHGRRTAVSGLYSYLLRVRLTAAAELRHPVLLTRFQHNPRTLPPLTQGSNELTYTATSPAQRTPVSANPQYAHRTANARYTIDKGQGYWTPANPTEPAELIFRLAAKDLTAIDAGARVLDLSAGFAPDKFTAEIRRVTPLPSSDAAASIAWSRTPKGPFETLWTYNPKLTWRDQDPITRTLPWQEVDRHAAIPGAGEIFVRFRFQHLALDSLRLAQYTQPPAGESPAVITHHWLQEGRPQSTTRTIPPGTRNFAYSVDIPPGQRFTNTAITLEAK